MPSVFNIQRNTLYDGKGVSTIVFSKDVCYAASGATLLKA
jgi:hypothetical protein